MVGRIEHGGDLGHRPSDLHLDALLEGDVRHAAALAAALEADIGGVLRDVDEGNVPAVGGHGRIDAFIQQLQDHLRLGRAQSGLGTGVQVVLDAGDLRDVMAQHVLDAAARGPTAAHHLENDEAVLEAVVDDVAAVLGHRRADAGVDEVPDLGADLVLFLIGAIASRLLPGAVDDGIPGDIMLHDGAENGGLEDLPVLRVAYRHRYRLGVERHPGHPIDGEQTPGQRRRGRGLLIGEFGRSRRHHRLAG